MVNPSHPGNVGSAARAIKTMGFSELVLVGPKFADVTSQPEAVALASGALDVLENARIYDTLEEALAPVTLAFALTARVRDLAPPALRHPPGRRPGLRPSGRNRRGLHRHRAGHRARRSHQ